MTADTASFLDRPPLRSRPAPEVEVLVHPEARFKRLHLELALDRPLDGRRAARTLLLEVLQQGSRDFPSQLALARRLQELWGAEMELEAGRIAECHRSTLHLSAVGERFLPPGEEVLPGLLDLVRSVLERPARGAGGSPFREEVVERERGLLLRRIRNLPDDRASWASERFLHHLCRDEPYGRPPWGTEEEVAALGAGDLEEARRDLLEHGSLLVVAAGPVQPERLQDLLEPPPGGAGAREAPPEPVLRRPEELREVQESLPVDQARFHFGFRFPPPADGPGWEALSLACSILGGGAHGRLFRIVREERSLAYGIYSVLHSRKGILAVEAGIDASRREEVRDEVLRQVRALAAGEFSAEELETARAHLLDGLRSLAEHPVSVARFWIRERQLGLQRTPAERARQLLETGPEAVAEAASRWLPDLVYLLGPEGRS